MRLIPLLFLLSSFCYANGPKYNFKDPKLNDEFVNVYKDIRGTKQDANFRGTTTNDAAQAGFIGEYISSTTVAANLPASLAWGDLASVYLSAGDWAINVLAEYENNSAVSPSYFDAGASTTSGNSSTGLTLGDTYAEIGASDIPSGANVMFASVPGLRFSLSAGTTVYLKVRASYGSGTPQAAGRISALRTR